MIQTTSIINEIINNYKSRAILKDSLIEIRKEKKILK